MIFTLISSLWITTLRCVLLFKLSKNSEENTTLTFARSDTVFAWSVNFLCSILSLRSLKLKTKITVTLFVNKIKQWTVYYGKNTFRINVIKKATVRAWTGKERCTSKFNFIYKTCCHSDTYWWMACRNLRWWCRTRAWSIFFTNLVFL